MKLRFAWAAFLPVIAVTYWLALFIATHIPRQFHFLERGRDKILHFGAFAGLGFLVTLCVRRWTRLTVPICAAIAITLIVYGAIDEYLQGVLTTTRKADWKDWVMDAAGATAGMLIAAVVVRYFHRDENAVELPRK